MSIKTKDGKRISDPASQGDTTEVRSVDIGVILQKGKDNGEKEIVILEDRANLKKPIMNQVISTELTSGMVFYTDEHIRAERAKRNAIKSVNDEQEIGE